MDCLFFWSPSMIYISHITCSLYTISLQTIEMYSTMTKRCIQRETIYLLLPLALSSVDVYEHSYGSNFRPERPYPAIWHTFFFFPTRLLFLSRFSLIFSTTGSWVIYCSWRNHQYGLRLVPHPQKANAFVGIRTWVPNHKSRMN